MLNLLNDHSYHDIIDIQLISMRYPYIQFMLLNVEIESNFSVNMPYTFCWTNNIDQKIFDKDDSREISW